MGVIVNEETLPPAVLDDHDDDYEGSPSSESEILRATGLISRGGGDDSDGNLTQLHTAELFHNFSVTTAANDSVQPVATDPSTEPTSSTPATLAALGHRKKLNKLLQRQQSDTVKQLQNFKISCLCEQVNADTRGV